MKDLTLLVMAAGAGTRYAGLKQIEPVGVFGESIIDYSIYDALHAGFSRVVFVIRRDIEVLFRDAVGDRFKKKMDVEYAFQELDSMPAGVSVPASRKKPWGTAHAILVAADVIDGPFAVINADDFYGRSSFQMLGEHLRSGDGFEAMVGFVLRNTLSEFGGVKRGVCKIGSDGFLESVTEFENIQKDGLAANYRDSSGIVRPLAGNELVSMNMWGFRPTLFPHLLTAWTEFLINHAQDEAAEFYIPDVITSIIDQGHEKFRVLSTDDTWFGMTYRDDRPFVVERIRSLVARGDYPERLWA